MIKASVMGATGYAGIELVRILFSHPEVEIAHLCSKSFAGQPLSSVYQNFRGYDDIILENLTPEEVAKDSDVVFTALPHGASKEVIPKLCELGVKVIDLSGDFRYNDVKVYEKWYGQEHSSPELLEKSVYGLCELHREEIKKADLIGNPGCYTTCSILALAPAVDAGIIDNQSIIVDAKSGVTGAGRGVALDYHFCECTENAKAYKIGTHRHVSEIEQELSLIAGEEITMSFTPHLIPLKRGIIATCYANLKKDISTAEVVDIYKKYYKDEFFVRVYDEGELPETNHVAGSNFVDIGIKSDLRVKRLVVVSCIDNIYKGAAGQAVQNMNLVFGLGERTGIENPGFYL